MWQEKDSPQKAALREMMSSYLKGHKVKDGTDVNVIMGDRTSVILEGALDEEMNEGLGYSMYDIVERSLGRFGHLFQVSPYFFQMAAY